MTFLSKYSYSFSVFPALNLRQPYLWSISNYDDWYEITDNRVLLNAEMFRKLWWNLQVSGAAFCKIVNTKGQRFGLGLHQGK
jgi:hypothetical protein